MAENTIILDADVKPLRKQLREATEELQMTRAKFGEMSDEAVKAAQKVAGIRDSINAANESAQLFDPGSRFQALTTAASTAAGGIAAVQGAMGLFGSESEEVEKALLKVQSAMALSQGLSQLADLGKVTDQLKTSFKGLAVSTDEKAEATDKDTDATVKNTIVSKAQTTATNVKTTAFKLLRGAMSAVFSIQTLLIVGIGLLVANFDKIKKAILENIPFLGELVNLFGKAVERVTDFVGITSEGERELEKLNKAFENNGKAVDRNIAKLSAQGGQEEQIFKAKKDRIEEELALLTKTQEVKGKLEDEEKERQADLNNQLQILGIEKEKFNADTQKKITDDAEKKSKERQANQEKMAAKTLAAQTILDEAKNQLLSQQKQEELAVEQSFQAKMKTLKEAGIVDDGTLADQRNTALKAIDDKFKAEEAQKEADFQKQVNDIRTQVRLEGIADENEKARESLLVDQENRRQAILMDEKTTQDQKRILLLELSVQEDQELKALQMTFDEAKAAQDLAELDKEIAKSDASFQIQKDLLDKKEVLLKEQLAAGLISEKQFNDENEKLTKARVDLAEKEADAKRVLLQAVSGSLNAAADVLGKDTKAGKALGVASATINTFQGISAGVKLGFPLAIPAVAMAAATGFAAVKNIMKVKVPGGDASSSPSLSMAAPASMPEVPTLGTSPVTALGTMMQNQPPLKAFVVESEVTGTQRRVADIERRAGF